MSFKTLMRFRVAFKAHRIFFIRHFKPKVKPLSTEFALSHFDQFYGSVFKNWTSIRLGLLSPHNYCAVINSFSNIKESVAHIQDLDVYNLKDIYMQNLIPCGNQNVSESSTENADEFSEIPQETDRQDFHNTLNEHLEAQYSPGDLSQDCDIDDYMPTTKYLHRDSEEDPTNFYDPNINYKTTLVKGSTILFPEHWEIYLSKRGKFKKFPPPKTDATGLLNYYLMDGASILPVLALDIKKGETIADLCASPGGKTLAILFGLEFGKLLCNDVSPSRLYKLKTVLNSYLPDTADWSKRIHVSNIDVCDWSCFESFDKILLDVPCTNDRLSVTKDANSIFSNKRQNERMQLPKYQTNMLSTALKALKVGGSLVYSTCSLSPIQNDGVVHIALSNLSTTCPMEFTVVDITESFMPLRSLYQFSDVCKYGQLVVPFLPLNYGPMYFSKIQRIN